MKSKISYQPGFHEFWAWLKGVALPNEHEKAMFSTGAGLSPNCTSPMSTAQTKRNGKQRLNLLSVHFRPQVLHLGDVQYMFIWLYQPCPRHQLLLCLHQYQLEPFSYCGEFKGEGQVSVSSLHRTEERQFWIGFNKRNPLNAGSWEWSDGTPVSLSDPEGEKMNSKQVALEPLDRSSQWTWK